MGRGGTSVASTAGVGLPWPPLDGGEKATALGLHGGANYKLHALEQKKCDFASAHLRRPNGQ